MHFIPAAFTTNMALGGADIWRYRTQPTLTSRETGMLLPFEDAAAAPSGSMNRILAGAGGRRMIGA